MTSPCLTGVWKLSSVLVNAIYLLSSWGHFSLAKQIVSSTVFPLSTPLCDECAVLGKVPSSVRQVLISEWSSKYVIRCRHCPAQERDNLTLLINVNNTGMKDFS